MPALGSERGLVWDIVSSQHRKGSGVKGAGTRVRSQRCGSLNTHKGNKRSRPKHVTVMYVCKHHEHRVRLRHTTPSHRDITTEGSGLI